MKILQLLREDNDDLDDLQRHLPTDLSMILKVVEEASVQQLLRSIMKAFEQEGATDVHQGREPGRYGEPMGTRKRTSWDDIDNTPIAFKLDGREIIVSIHIRGNGNDRSVQMSLHSIKGFKYHPRQNDAAGTSKIDNTSTDVHALITYLTALIKENERMHRDDPLPGSRDD